MQATDSFATRFEMVWKSPTPESLAALLTEDVVLRQPHMPPIKGKAAVLDEFRRLLDWIPGTHSVVRDSQQSGSVVYIEHELRFPVGKTVIRIPAVDRFVLREGLGEERTVYFDQLRLVRAVLRHPSLWPGYIQYRFGA